MKSPGIGLFSIEDYILIVYLDANFFLLLLKLIKDRYIIIIHTYGKGCYLSSVSRNGLHQNYV